MFTRAQEERANIAPRKGTTQMSEITLSSAVRDNLLSLQNTAKLMASTQFKLSTGLDVNSALDDPSAFFTAASLSNRAADLNTQLDNIDNGTRTLQAADEGISSLSSLVNQLKSTANSALNTKIDESDVTGSVDGLTAASTALSELGVASTTTVDITHDGVTTSVKLSNQTVEELASTIGNISGITSQVNSDGAIEIAAADGRELIVAGAAGTAAGIDGTVEGTNRDSYVNDFNDLLTQIDQLAGDATYNGVNLLNGDDLSVNFNEDGSSSLTISGVTFDADGLGLAETSDSELESDTSLEALIDTLDSAINTLRSQSSTFGNNLAVAENRDTFTNGLINTLNGGAADLTLADTTGESANLLALQTRQSLGTTSLSLANQSDQSVLQLF